MRVSRRHIRELLQFVNGAQQAATRLCLPGLVPGLVVLCILLCSVNIYFEFAWRADRWAFSHVEEALVSLDQFNPSRGGHELHDGDQRRGLRHDLVNGSIVHFTGGATYSPARLDDPRFGVSVSARRLSREVMHCQWMEQKKEAPSIVSGPDLCRHTKDTAALVCIGGTILFHIILSIWHGLAPE